MLHIQSNLFFNSTLDPGTAGKTLKDYCNKDLISKGLPTVQYVAESLNVSASYLGSLLRVLTGQNTQQHIHERLIEKAKEKLSSSDSSITEIAYALGFEHSQRFSKLFKTKSNLSPTEFRRAFHNLREWREYSKGLSRLFVDSLRGFRKGISPPSLIEGQEMDIVEADCK
jgi:AraC-like DNA-binding protein